MINVRNRRFSVIALFVAVLVGFGLAKLVDGPVQALVHSSAEDANHDHEDNSHAHDDNDDHGSKDGTEHEDEGVVSLTSRQIEASDISIVMVGRGGGLETRLAGRVISAIDAKAAIAAPVSGRVVQVNAAPGNTVEAGQALVILVSGEAATLYADTDTAIAAAEAARLIYQRDLSLVEQGVVARQELEASRAKSLAAGAAARAARAQMEAVGSPDAQGRIAITSPLAGTVGVVEVTPGGFVSSGGIVAEVSDPARTELAFSMPAAFAAQVAPGARMRVTSPAGSVEAVVVGVALDASERRGAALVRATPTAGTLPPVGSPVSGSIITNQEDGGLTVPADAVQMVDGQSVVFVFTEEGFRATPVLAGRRAGGQIEILKGLSGDERIAGTNAFLLKAELAKGEAEHVH
ncbi:efflux RND transporter periplasmic adaptor subunit [Halopseudomonas bauzanensis]|uniref:efflux RND transporter periplasmic adaptor subunit n=1 Tax=Halopseudomonas bauzanensis TaxID=653930 RepID=UPI0025578000|nr:efflux RND transporter periplasmic adaptor subunit [Halopseudomonas bauzanensis]